MGVSSCCCVVAPAPAAPAAALKLARPPPDGAAAAGMPTPPVSNQYSRAVRVDGEGSGGVGCVGCVWWGRGSSAVVRRSEMAAASWLRSVTWTRGAAAAGPGWQARGWGHAPIRAQGHRPPRRRAPRGGLPRARRSSGRRCAGAPFIDSPVKAARGAQAHRRPHSQLRGVALAVTLAKGKTLLIRARCAQTLARRSSH